MAEPARRSEPVASLLLSALVRTVSWWRTELAAAAALAALACWLTARLSPVAGAVLPAGLVAVVIGVPRVRRAAGLLLGRERARRRFYRGVHRAALPLLDGRSPLVRRVRRVPAGDLLEVAVPHGCRPADLEAGAETLAAALEVRDVRVSRDRVNARFARVLVVRRDPFDDPAPLAWPAADVAAFSLWEPVPAAVDEAGATVGMTLPERNVLLGGEPGAGKSAALSLLVAAAALDAAADLWLFDGKLVELATWSGCARFTVGPDVDEAVDVLRVLGREMDDRYTRLLAGRARKVTPGCGLRLQVVVCDELAYYLHAGERKARAEFADRMRDLVARGRAAGIIVLAATQKPSVDIVPSALRDLFGFRWALRCMTPQASDTILGQGWAAQGATAADIDAAQRGVGLLLHEGGTPVRCRSYYLDDDQLAALSRRAEARRAGGGELAGAAPTDGVAG